MWRVFFRREGSICQPFLLVFQNLKQQYYTGYMESEVLEVMQHMAKNVVKVNENLTKFIVSVGGLSVGKPSILGSVEVCYQQARWSYSIVSKEWNVLVG